MADASDSKSDGGNLVWVQVPPSVFFISKQSAIDKLKRLYKISVFTFLDGVMRLSDPLEIEYNKAMRNLQNEHGIDYLLNIEYFALQKGREEGIHLAHLEDARQMLAEGIDIAVIKRITKLSDAELASLSSQ